MPRGNTGRDLNARISRIDQIERDVSAASADIRRSEQLKAEGSIDEALYYAVLASARNSGAVAALLLEKPW